MSLIVYYTSLLLQGFLFCREAEAAIVVTSRSSNPSVTQEFQNITLEWNYTLGAAAFGVGQLFNVPDVGSPVLIAQRYAGSSTNIPTNFQQQFRADISDTEAWLTILSVQRTDQGTYRMRVNDQGVGSSSADVDVVVNYPSNITHISENQTVNQNDTVHLNCTADGFPSPNINWTRLPGDTPVSMPLDITGKQDEGLYRCTANNSIGNAATAEVFITVQNYSPINFSLTSSLSNDVVVANTSFTLTCSAQASPPACGILLRLVPPEIGYVSHDQDICEGSLVTLSCNATGRPTPNITWTRVTDNGTDSAPLPAVDGTYVMSNITRSSNGTYRCTATNGAGTVNLTVQVMVRYPPSVNRIVNSSDRAVEGLPFNMTCEASGDPMPNNYTWITVDTGQRYNGNILAFPKLNRSYTGEYRCEADNRCGKGSRVQSIDVLYPPFVTDYKQNITVTSGTLANLPCPVDGYPEPNITWYKGDDISGRYLHTGKEYSITPTKSEDGWYTCFAKNSEGNVTASLRLIVEQVNTTTGPTDGKVKQIPAEVTVTMENGTLVKFLPAYNDLNSPPSKVFVNKFVKEMNTTYENVSSYKTTEVTALREGSVIVSFTLFFKILVTTNEGLARLNESLIARTFGTYEAGDLKIIQHPTTSATPTTKTTSKPTDGKKGVLSLAIIFGAVGGGLVLLIVIGVTAWYMHKKRKCRKDTKIGHCESEAPVLQEGAVDDNAYSQANDGYARSGPPSADDVRQEAVVAVPTYAVVDKSKKKKNQKEEKLVDKSKKKKKKDEKEDYTYAEVDMSKKTSMKQQPRNADGLLYADVGDFQKPPMPPVSTSPEALPPVKRPQAYEGTQYADITEFLKGDATLPKKRNSQGMEMQPQTTPPANGSSQGNEVKP